MSGAGEGQRNPGATGVTGGGCREIAEPGPGARLAVIDDGEFRPGAGHAVGPAAGVLLGIGGRYVGHD